MIRNLIFSSVSAERDRQDEKWGRANGIWGDSNDRKLTILAEEFGEVARAILEEDFDNMRVEIVQCAALCVAWMEHELSVAP